MTHIERSDSAPPPAGDGGREFATMTVDGQMFGIPVLTVQDVIVAERITRVPMAPPEIAGSLNLRGRIVTAIDMRVRLGLPAREPGRTPMSVVVDHEDELYSLLVDEVGDVLWLPDRGFEHNPPTLDPAWRGISAGLYRLEQGLLVVIDVPRLLDSARSEAA